MEYNQQPKRLSVAHLKLFVAVLIQNKIVFKHFIDKLAVDHFPDEMFQLLYRVVIDFYKEMTELPSLVEIEAELAAYYEADEFIVSDEEKEELDEFIDWAFDSGTWGTVDLPDGAKLERFAFKAGKKLLQQANSIALIRDIAAVADLDQLPALLLQAQAQAEIVNLLGEQKPGHSRFQVVGIRTNLSWCAPPVLGSLISTCPEVLFPVKCTDSWHPTAHVKLPWPSCCGVLRLSNVTKLRSWTTGTDVRV